MTDWTILTVLGEGVFDGALRGAIIGGIVGGVIGLLYQVFFKKKDDSANNKDSHANDDSQE